MRKITGGLIVLAALGVADPALAQIKVGVTVSSTGPAASLGIPEKNAIELLPREIGGKHIEYVVLDDASDTTTAVTNTRKLITDDKVDVIIGSTTTPNSLAMLPVLGELKTSAISLASSNRIIEPMDSNRMWMFKTPQTDTMMAIAIAEDMSNHGVKTVAFIGFSDALGEAFWTEVSKFAEAARYPGGGQRALRPYRYVGYGTNSEDHVGAARRSRDRGLWNARSDSGESAHRTRLQRPHLSQPWRGESRLPARVRTRL